MLTFGHFASRQGLKLYPMEIGFLCFSHLSSQSSKLFVPLPPCVFYVIRLKKSYNPQIAKNDSEAPHDTQCLQDMFQIRKYLGLRHFRTKAFGSLRHSVSSHTTTADVRRLRNPRREFERYGKIDFQGLHVLC